MKKLFKKLSASMLIVGCIMSSSAFAAELDERAIEEGTLSGATAIAEDRYDEYEFDQTLVDQWDDPIANVGGSTWREMQRPQSASGMDFDAYIRSEIGYFGLISNSMLVNYGSDLENPENISYWESVGMKHEAHDIEDVNEDWRVADNAWITLTPLSAYEEENSDRKYPVLFVWHGNGNPINLAEGYGFGEVAAEKEWIVVYPWASNDDNYLEEFDRIMEELRANYPIDEARIYSTGFSKGSRVTQRLAIERADVLAAAVSNGASDAWAFEGREDTAGALAIALTVDDLNGNEAIPIAFFGGEFDPHWPVDHEGEAEIQAANNWLTVLGLEANQSVDQSKNLRKFSDNVVEQQMGLKFDDTSVVHEDGIDYWIGRFYNEDGICVLQYTEAGGAIHWPTQYMSIIAVDFLNQFAKNVKTGLTEYIGDIS